MDTKLFIGNIAFSETEDSLNQLFSQYGSVASCHLITDKDTGRSKGFVFVEMCFGGGQSRGGRSY